MECHDSWEPAVQQDEENVYTVADFMNMMQKKQTY